MSPLTELIAGAKAYGWSSLIPTGPFESISTYSVGSTSQTTIDFSSIPTSYTNLQLRYIARNSAANYFVRIGFNNDTTASNYAYHVANGTGASTTAGYENSYMYAPRVFSGSPGSTFGLGIVDILDYRNTNKNKAIRGYGGFDNNGSGEIDFLSGFWMNTSAITSIQISAYGGQYPQYSHFALYGIRSVA